MYIRQLNTSGLESACSRHSQDVIAALEQSDRLLHATWNQDGEAVAAILDAVHSQNTSILTYNDKTSKKHTCMMEQEQIN